MAIAGPLQPLWTEWRGPQRGAVAFEENETTNVVTSRTLPEQIIAARVFGCDIADLSQDRTN
eukprot:scaffold241_cov242-Pinguiococcus_pyrenoidosus.AAC.32